MASSTSAKKKAEGRKLRTTNLQEALRALKGEDGKGDVVELDMSYARIGDEGAKAIGEALKSNGTLSSLDLGTNNIGDEGARAIGEGLKSNGALSSLDLSLNRIRDEGAKAIGEALKVNRTLTSLNLHGNRISDEGAKAIGDALESNGTLASVDLGVNSIGDEGAKAIGEALKLNGALTSLTLSFNQIGDEGTKAVGEALKLNGTLSSLDLGHNQIGDEGAMEIGEALKLYGTLSSLDLGHNQIGDEGAKEIGEALKVNGALTSLKLDSNHMGDKAAKAIGEGLKLNGTLASVDLGGNLIGDEGATEIGEGLKSNGTVTTLNLPLNKIGDEGAKAIGEALKPNEKLTRLSLIYNHIGDEGAKAIGDAMKSNRTLTSLDMYGNQIGDGGVLSIRKQLESNAMFKSWNLAGDLASESMSGGVSQKTRLLMTESVEEPTKKMKRTSSAASSSSTTSRLSGMRSPSNALYTSTNDAPSTSTNDTRPSITVVGWKLADGISLRYGMDEELPICDPTAVLLDEDILPSEIERGVNLLPRHRRAAALSEEACERLSKLDLLWYHLVDSVNQPSLPRQPYDEESLKKLFEDIYRKNLTPLCLSQGQFQEMKQWLTTDSLSDRMSLTNFDGVYNEIEEMRPEATDHIKEKYDGLQGLVNKLSRNSRKAYEKINEEANRDEHRRLMAAANDFVRFKTLTADEAQVRQVGAEGEAGVGAEGEAGVGAEGEAGVGAGVDGSPSQNDRLVATLGETFLHHETQTVFVNVLDPQNDHSVAVLIIPSQGLAQKMWEEEVKVLEDVDAPEFHNPASIVMHVRVHFASQGTSSSSMSEADIIPPIDELFVNPYADPDMKALAEKISSRDSGARESPSKRSSSSTSGSSSSSSSSSSSISTADSFEIEVPRDSWEPFKGFVLDSVKEQLGANPEWKVGNGRLDAEFRLDRGKLILDKEESAFTVHGKGQVWIRSGVEREFTGDPEARKLGNELHPPAEVHSEQRRTAEDLVNMARDVLTNREHESLSSRFSNVDFLILVPNYTTLRQQTMDRIESHRLVLGAGGSNESVEKRCIMYNHTEHAREAFDEFKSKALSEANKSSLFVLIADECHWGATLGGYNDRFVNDPYLVESDNVLLLLVSATPQNVLTRDSRIPRENVLRWTPSKRSETVPLYRSLDYYVSTIGWRLPPQTNKLILYLEKEQEQEQEQEREQEHEATGAVVRLGTSTVSLDVGRVYPTHKFDGFIRYLEDEMRKSLHSGGMGQESRSLKLEVKKYRKKLGFRLLPFAKASKLRLRISNDPQSGSLLKLLGFLQDENEIILRPSAERARYAESEPLLLCDPESTNWACRPKPLQRVRADAAFSMLHERFNAQFGKRGKVRNSKSRVGAARYRDGHLVLCSYLQSLVYFRHFRVSGSFLGTKQGKVLAPLVSENDLAQAKARVTDEALEAFLDTLADIGNSLGFKEIMAVVEDVTLAQAPPADSDEEDGDDDDDDGDDDNDDGDDEDENSGNNVKVLSSASPRTAKRKVWKQIVLRKLEEEFKPTGNKRDAVFSETDRCVKILLNVSPVDNSDTNAGASANANGQGSMVITRVYEKDENKSIEKTLQKALEKLDLMHGHPHRRPIFAPIGDHGEENLYNIVVNNRWHEVKLYKRENGEFCSIEDIRTSSLRATTNTRSVRELQYQDLKDLPCLVILCDKGRMGDTFPHSLRCLDLRLRTSGTYTTFVQEFGRVCRYPGHSETRDFDGAMRELEECHTAISFVVKRSASSDEIVGHADTPAELRSLWTECNKGGCIYRYDYPLPTVLLKREVMQKLEKAIDMKSQSGTESSIMECLPMGTLDGRVRPASKGLNMGTLVTKIKSGENPLHGERAYREKYKAGTNQGNHYDSLKHTSRTQHELGKNGQHRRRLLLWAECQLGKTSAYLHFLALLRDELSISCPIRCKPARVRFEVSPQLPYWHDLHDFSKYPRLEKCYDEPKVGHYLTASGMLRFSVLSSVDPAQNAFAGNTSFSWVDSYVSKLKRGVASAGESVVSEAGQRKLNDLAHRLKSSNEDFPLAKTNDPLRSYAVVPGCEHILDQCLNWDGRLERVLNSDRDVLTIISHSSSSIVSRLWKGVYADSFDGIDDMSEEPVDRDVDYMEVDSQDKSSEIDEKRPEESIKASRLAPEKLGCATSRELSYRVPKTTPQAGSDIYCGLCSDSAIQVSVPSSWLELFVIDKAQIQELNSLNTDCYRTWVWIASYGRSEQGAFFDYQGVIDAQERPIVLVTRYGCEFRRYRQLYGDTFIIVQLPESARIRRPLFDHMDNSWKGIDDDVSCDEGGIGFARLFSQLLAYNWNLSHIWMLDDNVIATYSRKKQGRKCCFEEVMFHLETLAQCNNTNLGLPDRVNRFVTSPEELRGKAACAPQGEVLIRHARQEAAADPPREPSNVAEYSGPTHNFAVIGIHRGFRNWSQVTEMFTTTHSIYSFFLLGVKTTVEHGVFFPPKQWGEDIEFLHLADEANLICLKSALFTHLKAHSRRTIVSDELCEWLAGKQRKEEFDIKWGECLGVSECLFSSTDQWQTEWMSKFQGKFGTGYGEHKLVQLFRPPDIDAEACFSRFLWEEVKMKAKELKSRSVILISRKKDLPDYRPSTQNLPPDIQWYECLTEYYAWEIHMEGCRFCAGILVDGEQFHTVGCLRRDFETAQLGF